MELRRLGLVRKPAVVVPNNMLEQFGREFSQLYPQARLLVAAREDLAGDKRRAFVGRVATGDYDAVIMTRGAFERLPLSGENQKAYIEQESDRFRQWLEGVKAAAEAGSERGLTVKRTEKALASAEERTKKALDKPRDPGITFEQTGLDYLVVDEAHAYKNLRTPSNITGAAIEGSQRAQDLDMKLSWLRGQQGDRAVTLATATPIANSITETYVMQKLARPDLLEAAGVVDFDSWAATFGQLTSSEEMTPDAAGFRVKERFSKFVNVPELLRLWHVSADIKTAADLALPTPELPVRADGVRAPETVLIAPSPELEAFVAELGERAEKIRGGGVDPAQDNMLKISSEGRAAALDLRLLPGRTDPDTTVSGPGVAPEVSDPDALPENKIATAAENITRIWAEHRADTFARPDGTTHPTPGALQIVFCDLGTPVRQGNQYPEAQILRYVTEGSFDGYSYQTVERKSRFIDQVMHGRLDVREIEDVGDATLSYDEVKALASGDPRDMEKAQVDADVARLERLERGHHRGQSQLDATIASRSEQLTSGTAERDRLDAAIAARRPTRGDAFAAEIDGTRYTDRGDYAAALAAELAQPSGAPTGSSRELGDLGGLTVTASSSRDPDTHRRRIELDFAEAPGYPVAVDPAELDARPTRAVASLENRLAGLERRRDQLQQSLDTAEQEIDRARSQLGTPFARAEELAAARAKAEELRHAVTDLAVPSASEPQPHATGQQPDPGPEAGTRPHSQAETAGAAEPTVATDRQPTPAAAEVAAQPTPDDDGRAEQHRGGRRGNARPARRAEPGRDPRSAAHPRASQRLAAEFNREADLDDELAAHRRGHQPPRLDGPEVDRARELGPGP